jgi:hypothetical protein
MPGRRRRSMSFMAAVGVLKTNVSASESTGTGTANIV